MLSDMNDLYYFGMLISMCISLALLADYFIAPSLILLFKPFGKEFNPNEKVEIDSPDKRNGLAIERL
ncbi:MAG: hypothetical protein SVZ03_03585 [Spirochaetota bacterium]|nr:hypothetical protein [Spirochaetota bacterium]